MKVIVFLYAMVGMLSAIAAEAHVQRRSPSTTVDAQSIYKQRLAARQYKHRPHKLVTRQDGSCPAPIPVPSARTPSCGTSGCSFCSGGCVDYATDESNCGACGTVCPGGQTCTSGTCTPPPCTQAQLDTGNCPLSLIRNGDFSTALGGIPSPWSLSSGWTYNPGGAYSPNAHVFWRTPGAVLSQSTAAVAGRRYTVSFWAGCGNVSNKFTVRFGDLEATIIPARTFTKYTYNAIARGTDTFSITMVDTPSDGDIDRVTIVEAP